MTEDVELDYEYLMQNALRGMMRDVLSMVADLGDAPGEHHFYIEFFTGAPGVSIPDHLRESYPERMTIVLQHQFENLMVAENGFSITLWFKGKGADLKIPFAAVTSFADPSVKFGLRFEPVDDSQKLDEEAERPASNELPTEKSAKREEPKEQEKGDSADVVSLDAFRKK